MRKVNQKRAAVLAWALCIFCIVSAITQAIIWLVRTTAPSSLYDLVETFGWGVAVSVGFAIPAALIIARQPGNRVGWLMMLPALVIASPFEAILANLSAPPVAFSPGLWLVVWLNGWSWIPIIFPVFLIPLHFPTGRPPSPRWRWINSLALGMWLFFAVWTALAEKMGPINGGWTLPNPIGFLPYDVFEGVFGIVWGIGLATVVSSSVVSLVVRYRRAHFGERQQIKWLLFGGAGFALYYVLTIPLEDDQRSVGWVNLLFVCSILAIPIAIAIAILRHRLYDIDVIIRKTLIYGVLTALLALIYFGGIVFLQGLVGRVAGEESPLVLVLTTLLIAALFSPLRRRVQVTIDRRFYRGKYDAQQVLAHFAQTARDEVEIEALTAELARVVQESMQPESLSIWLKKEKPSKQSDYTTSF